MSEQTFNDLTAYTAGAAVLAAMLGDDTYRKMTPAQIVGAASGAVLQVQSTTKTDIFSTTATSFTDITGLSVSITPRSTASKVLVLASVLASSSNTGSPKLLRLMRDSTAIAIGDADGSRTRSTSEFVTTSDPLDATTVSVNHLDSPGSASAITYKLQMITAGGTGYVNRGGSDGDFSFVGRFVSSITVMEIAG